MKKKSFVIIIVALLLRLLFFICESPWNERILQEKIIAMGTDQGGYHQLALNLINFQELKFKENLPPVALRTPGYPIFIAFNYLVFGVRPWVAIIIQILIDSVTALIIFITVRNLTNEKIGFIAGLVYAFDPHLILHSNSYYSETLFIFSLTIFLFFLISFYTDSKYLNRKIILSGIFLGVATLIKPASAYLPYLISVFLLLFLNINLTRRIKKVILFLLAFFITISPWLIRNQIIFGKLFLSNSGEYNLLAINITPMELPKRGLPQHIVEYQLRSEADSLMYAQGQRPIFDRKPSDYWEELTLKFDYKKTEFWKKIAFKYIKENPFDFLKFYTIGIFHSLFNLGSKEFAYFLNFTDKPSSINLKEEQNIFNLLYKFFSEKSLSEIIIGFLIAVYLIFIYISLGIGLKKIISSQDKIIYILLIIIAFYFLLVAGAGGLARFKLPAIPFYLVFVGLGIAEILNWINLKRFKKV